MKKRFSEEQIIGFLKEADGGVPVKDLCRSLYESDSQVRSGCNRACEAQWIPLLAPEDEKPLGYWTILVRKDGRRQWAFEHHPVYTHLHDTPDKPTGAGAHGAWHLMPHFRR